MSEAEPPPSPPPPPPVRRPPPRLWARAARWGAELVTVFVGVYAAFMLNNYQSHRQERQRREQILDWMEKEFTEDLEDIKREQALMKEQQDKFTRQIDAGALPAIRPLAFDSDYDASDMASVMSSGGFDLLEVETVRLIRDTEATERLMLGMARHDQQLSDALILPNLDKDPGFFYDPATHKLRPSYGWYIDFFPKMLRGFNELRLDTEKLLVQIRAERQRNR